MTIEMMPLWELVLDGVQILLCAGILFFLIRNRIKYKRLVLSTPSDDVTSHFSNEIRIQQLKQATEHALDTIVDNIQQERLALQKFYSPHNGNLDIAGSSVTSSISLSAGPPAEEQQDVDASDFGEILRLSEKGLSTREISRRVNMPRGEVELVLRLNEKNLKGKRRSNINARV
jgi:hypothetical protein